MSLNPQLKCFFEEKFYERYWGSRFDESVNRKEAVNVLRLLGAREGHILDWRSGWGRHAYYFAKQGFKVTLLDFIERYLKDAEKRFKKEGLKLNVINEDSRNTPSEIQADYAVCLMNSVGFMTLKEEVKAFRSLYKALKPGAKIVIDCENLFYIARNFQKIFKMTDDDKTVYRSEAFFDLKTNVLHKSFQIIRPEGPNERREFNQIMYTPRDLAALVKLGGFEVDELYGSYEGEPLTFESPRIVISAYK